MLILVGISLSVLRGENGILVQTKSARIKTELSKFMEEGEFAYSELYAERVNSPEVLILESDIISRLMSNYGYEGRITEITDGVPTSITIGNITKDIVANGEKVVIGVQKGGGNSTYYVELLGKYYPIHFNNLEISVKEEEGQEQAGKIDNTEFTAVSNKEEVVIATAKNTNGVLTIELEGKSRGTADVTVTYGTLESKTINVNVKGKTRIIVEAEIDSETGEAKGAITSPTEVDKEYVDGENITLTAEPASSYKLTGWYIGDTKLNLDENNQYTVPNNLTGNVTITAKFKGTEPTDIFVSWEENTGTLRFYNSEHIENPNIIVGELYKSGNENINFLSYSGYVPWDSYRSLVNTIIFEDEVVPLYIRSWFFNLTNLIEIKHLNRLDTSKLTSMSSMFYSCENLREIDLSNFETLNVRDMSHMFYRCKNVTELDLSNFNTSNVTQMSSMFNGCENLTCLDLTSFDTSRVSGKFGMISMFSGCKNLMTLNINSFTTSGITSMSAMFSNCIKLENLNLSSFDTSNVTDMSSMFFGCKSLKTLDLSNFDTSDVITMRSMFGGSYGDSASDYYSGCSSLTELDLSNFDTSKVENMSAMFACCSNLKRINVSSFNTISVENMSGMFACCNNLQELDLSNFNTSNVTNMSFMFGGGFYQGAAEGCSSLTSLDLSTFNTCSVTNMNNMFCNCSNLKSLNLGTFNTSNVAYMKNIFKGCKEIEKIYTSSLFVTTKVTGNDSISYLFLYCYKLVGGNGTIYDSNKTGKTYARIDTDENPGYFTDVSQKPTE